MLRIVVTETGTLVLNTTDDTNTISRLLRDDGTMVDFDVLGGYGSNFRVAYHLEAGTYYLRVSGYDPDAIGNYRLHMGFTADTEQPAAEIPLFLAAPHAGRQGFIRLLSASDVAGIVGITAFDDEGVQHGPVTLSIDSSQTRHLNSDDLEKGNPSKGLAGRTGAGSGDWRLRFDTDLQIEVGAYIRTSDGYLTPMHDSVHFCALTGSHFVPVFNPGSNTDRLSKLRLINPDTTRRARVVIYGQDDAGPGASASARRTRAGTWSGRRR